MIGRFDEGIAEGERAMRLDPLSPAILVDAAWALQVAGRATEALELDRRTSDLDPTFYYPAAQEALAALYVGNVREAMAKFREARTLGAPAYITAYLAYSQAISGDRAGAMATLDELQRMSPGGKVAPYNLALLYLGLGDRARTLDYLEQAYAGNSQQIDWLKVDPIFKSLRAEPRFVALLKQMHFLK